MKSLKRLFVVSWCLLCLSMGVSPQASHAAARLIEPTLTVTPTVPTVTAPVAVMLAGIWRDACVPSYESHLITGQTIIINLEPVAPVCGQVETPWSITVALGHLPAATYKLQVTGVVTMSTDVTVSANFSYLPLVSGD